MASLLLFLAGLYVVSGHSGCPFLCNETDLIRVHRNPHECQQGCLQVSNVLLSSDYQELFASHPKLPRCNAVCDPEPEAGGCVQGCHRFLNFFKDSWRQNLSAPIAIPSLIGSTSVTLQVTLPLAIPRDLQYAQLQIEAKLAGEVDNWTTVAPLHWGTSIVHVYKFLMPFTKYRFRVRLTLFNVIDMVSLESDVIRTAADKAAKPSSIRNFSVIMGNGGLMKMEWQEPLWPRAPINHYRLELRNANTQNLMKTQDVPYLKKRTGVTSRISTSGATLAVSVLAITDFGVEGDVFVKRFDSPHQPRAPTPISLLFASGNKLFVKGLGQMELFEFPLEIVSLENEITATTALDNQTLVVATEGAKFQLIKKLSSSWTSVESRMIQTNSALAKNFQLITDMTYDWLNKRLIIASIQKHKATILSCQLDMDDLLLVDCKKWDLDKGGQVTSLTADPINNLLLFVLSNQQSTTILITGLNYDNEIMRVIRIIEKPHLAKTFVWDDCKLTVLTVDQEKNELLQVDLGNQSQLTVINHDYKDRSKDYRKVDFMFKMPQNENNEESLYWTNHLGLNIESNELDHGYYHTLFSEEMRMDKPTLIFDHWPNVRAMNPIRDLKVFFNGDNWALITWKQPLIANFSLDGVISNNLYRPKFYYRVRVESEKDSIVTSVLTSTKTTIKDLKANTKYNISVETSTESSMTYSIFSEILTKTSLMKKTQNSPRVFTMTSKSIKHFELFGENKEAIEEKLPNGINNVSLVRVSNKILAISDHFSIWTKRIGENFNQEKFNQLLFKASSPIMALAISDVTQSVYVSMPQESLVLRVSLESSSITSLLAITEPVKNIDLDEYTGHMCMLTSSLMCSDLNGLDANQVVKPNQGQSIISFAMDKEKHILYVVLKNNLLKKIEILAFNYEGEVIQSTDLEYNEQFNIRGLMRFWANQLLWINNNFSIGLFELDQIDFDDFELNQESSNIVDIFVKYDPININEEVLLEPVEPRNIRLLAQNASVIVSWLPTSTSNLFDITVESDHLKQHFSTKTSSITLNTILRPLDRLEVYIRVRSRWTTSKITHVTLKSPEKVSSEPQNLRLFTRPIDTNVIEVILRWNEPKEPNGEISMYLINAKCECNKKSIDNKDLIDNKELIDEYNEYVDMCNMSKTLSVSPSNPTHLETKFKLIMKPIDCSSNISVAAVNGAGIGANSRIRLMNNNANFEYKSLNLIFVIWNTTQASFFDRDLGKNTLINAQNFRITWPVNNRLLALLIDENAIIFVDDDNALKKATLSTEMNEVINIQILEKFEKRPSLMTIHYAARLVYLKVNKSLYKVSYDFEEESTVVLQDFEAEDMAVMTTANTLYYSTKRKTFLGQDEFLLKILDLENLNKKETGNNSTKKCNCTMKRSHEGFLLLKDSRIIMEASGNPTNEEIAVISPRDSEGFVRFNDHFCACNNKNINNTNENILKQSLYTLESCPICQFVPPSCTKKLLTSTESNLDSMEAKARSEHSVLILLPEIKPINCTEFQQSVLPVIKFTLEIEPIQNKDNKKDKGNDDENEEERSNDDDGRVVITHVALSQALSDRKVVLNHLKPFTQYKIGVKSVQIGEISHYLSNNNSSGLVVRTKEGIPTAPRGVGAVAMSPTMMYVFWKRSEEKNGQEVSYEVHYRLDKKIVITHFHMPQMRWRQQGSFEEWCSTTINNLESGQNYTLWVVARTKHAKGTRSKELISLTMPKEINLPKLVRAEPRELLIEWTAPNDGRIKGHVFIVASKFSEYRRPLQGAFVSEKNKNYTLNLRHLTPGTDYSVQMQISFAWSDERGEERVHQQLFPKDQSLKMRTVSALPLAPTPPYLRIDANHDQIVAWSEEDDNIELFELQLQAVQWTNESRWERVYMDKSPFWQLSGLNDTWVYLFRARARNERGWSPFSKSSNPVDMRNINLHHNKQGSGFRTVLALVALALLISTTALILVLHRLKPNAKRDQTKDSKQELATLRSLPINMNVHHTNPLYEFDEKLSKPCKNDLQHLQRIARKDITLTRFIGSGAFGEVYEGRYANNNGASSTNNDVKGAKSSLCFTKVAIKTLRGSASSSDEAAFLREALLMSKFAHSHILALIGICLDNEPSFLILELMEAGDLLSFLRAHRKGLNKYELGTNDLVRIAKDVCEGCAYLESQNFVHRDLAARNCLVSTVVPSRRVVKIGDFGLARNLYESDYYLKQGKGLMPVRWMAPECLLDGLFSTNSDVWAFGVVLFEIFSRGQQPYAERSNTDVMTFVRGGGHLEVPEECNLVSGLANLVLRCFLYRPEERPSFARCLSDIAKMLTNDANSEENRNLHKNIQEEIDSGQGSQIDNVYLRFNSASTRRESCHETKDDTNKDDEIDNVLLATAYYNV